MTADPDRLTVDEARRQLGAFAIVSVSEAARLLPVRGETARAWLHERGIVRNVPGLGEMVVWADVVDAVRLVRGPTETKPAPRAMLPRAGIQPRKEK